ncbi:hypothetical protein C2S53_016125 [Perilla frutescens var. hirtella]|uniref:DC1 domain-containing protein n=1 Tax=Perilla frutescens var. hirtella TaxID=608512 RepID=A0AAD4J4E5_PERFH|nr:hypothetical protein C2S53_016125 [Perilla frutescens var. hirtella]
MGKPSAEPSSNPTSSITHFSHPHPLHLFNPQTLLPQIFHCSACKLAASTTSVYACINCNFALHPECSHLPQQINHPFDQKHSLTLYPKPVYPEGLFNCDACGNRGGGFSYHCSPCGIDLHTTCASLPLTLTHHCHHHSLTLTFSAPYPGNTFSCDICKKLGSKTWIYRCATCEFDVHLACVATIIPPVSTAPTQQLPYITPRSTFIPPRPSNAGAYGPRPAVGGQVVATTYPAVMPLQAAYQPPAYRPANGLRDQIAVAAAEGIASGVAQSATQALFQGLFGGGGGVTGMDGGGVATIDECSYYDGGYGGTDGGGGYSGEDGSY